MMSAAAVNKTFVSPGIIKWSGFQVIGESLLNVLHCQHHPYNLATRDELLERAILETPDASEQVYSPCVLYPPRPAALMLITGTGCKIARTGTTGKKILFKITFRRTTVDFKSICTTVTWRETRSYNIVCKGIIDCTLVFGLGGGGVFLAISSSGFELCIARLEVFLSYVIGSVWSKIQMHSIN